MNVTRRFITAGISLSSASILTSCGTLFYPDRVNQKHRGDLDPSVVILDAVGLVFFLIPGIIAFAVDFSTGAIYFPKGHGLGDREETIFDKVDARTKLDQQEIQRMVAEHTGLQIDLGVENATAMRIENLREFDQAYAMLSKSMMLAANG